MTIKIGDRLPNAVFTTMTPDGPAARTTDEIFKGHKVVLFAVPGAFTPTCHRNHLPGFIARADEIKGKGVDTIAVTSVNDVFVMDAWEKDSKADGKILFLSDGSANFAKALGLQADMSDRNFGMRSKRYSMLVDDGVVMALNVEDSPGQADLSGAKMMLTQI
ncbi:MAG: peroxiredoxin [Hyphomicrobiales bacterium]|nr:peroxiredoxin [Hyphomicrobiales bacterium]